MPGEMDEELTWGGSLASEAEYAAFGKRLLHGRCGGPIREKQVLG